MVPMLKWPRSANSASARAGNKHGYQKHRLGLQYYGNTQVVEAMLSVYLISLPDWHQPASTCSQDFQHENRYKLWSIPCHANTHVMT